MMSDLENNFAHLVGSFAQYLRSKERSGIYWVPAKDSPRFSDVVVNIDAEDETIELSKDSLSDKTTSTLEEVRAELGDCRRCQLYKGRTNIVFGTGNPCAEIMFIGEAPGQDEDIQGEPFVGAAGQLLTKMIKAMGLERQEVYIGNIIKCRPPKNRDPLPDEIDECEPFLLRQIEVIKPRIIIALGNFAAKTLLRTETGITRLRGQWHAYQGIPLMPTFHPAYLLRNSQGKRPAWEDLRAVMAEMDRMGLFRRR